MRPTVWGALVLLSLAAACQGADSLSVDVAIGWDGAYRPLEWTPVQVGVLSTRKEPMGGMLWVKAQQDSLTTLSVRQQVVVQPKTPLNIPLVTRLIPGGGTCDVSLTDDRGRTQWSAEIGLLSYYGDGRGPLPLDPQDMLIGLVGRRSAGVAQLGQHAVSRSDEGRGTVYVKDKLAPSLPWDWTGYASLDVLLLYDPDWDQINAGQGKAIGQWVSNGGKVLFILGGRPPPASGPLAELLPVKIGSPRRLAVRAADLPFEAPRRRDANGVTAWTLEDLRDPGWTLERFSGEAVLAHGQVGFGRVGVLAFDPAELVGDSPENAAALWHWCTKGLLDRRELVVGGAPSESPPPSPGGPGYPSGYPGGRGRTASEQAINSVLGHLLQIPELRPLSIWWVIGLLAVLALLLGPVDYFILKRLDRLPLTWVTSAVLIVLFTVGAYYGVQALRAGATQVRSVTVTDAIEGGPVWSTSYSGIFASSSDDYRLEGLAGGQWWSGLSPASESDHYGYRGGEISTRRIYCHQQDGASVPYSLPISIWSMQCLLTERSLEQAPFSAEVAVSGHRATVEITNHSDARIHDAWIGHWDRAGSLGPVPAKGTSRFEVEVRSEMLTLGRRGEALLLEALGEAGAAGTACRSPGTVQRSAAIDAYLKRGAAVVYAVYEDSPACCRVSGATQNTTHTELVRLVVFPKKGGAP